MIARTTAAIASTRPAIDELPSRRRPTPPALTKPLYPLTVRINTRNCDERRSGEQRQQRLELHLGLRELLGGHRIAHDPAARVEVGDRSAQQRAAQRHAELAVLAEVGPAHRAGVPTPVEAL